MLFETVAFGGVPQFSLPCLFSDLFPQLCGCFAARNMETLKHGPELGGTQTRAIKHNGRMRNHTRPMPFVSLDLAVLGGQSENGREVLL